MICRPDPEMAQTVFFPVVVGVDTHRDQHVAVAIDWQCVRLGECRAPATTSGCGELERWSRTLGVIHAFGIEGTGSYCAGIARFLSGRGYTVVEVNRPDRSTRDRRLSSLRSSLASMSSWTRAAAVVKPTDIPFWPAASPKPRATWVLSAPLLPMSLVESRYVQKCGRRSRGRMEIP